jgi:two-component system, cell cycle sensor histidine kinase and response regulator CckA
MSAGNYLYLPASEALRWFKVLAVFRFATSQGENPGFELPPERMAWRLTPPHGYILILIIDDQALLREAVGEYLAMQGYEVKAAESGAAAMRLLEDGLQPDLLLCDVMLPDIHGAGFAREAQLLVPTARTLFMSGHTHESLLPEIGGAEFLQKPFRLDVLARRVRNLLATIERTPQ